MAEGTSNVVYNAYPAPRPWSAPSPLPSDPTSLPPYRVVIFPEDLPTPIASTYPWENGSMPMGVGRSIPHFLFLALAVADELLLAALALAYSPC